jgi:hypothetical protein
MSKLLKWFYDKINTHSILKKFTVYFYARTESNDIIRTQQIKLDVDKEDVLIVSYVDDYNFKLIKIINNKYEDKLQKIAEKLLKEFRQNDYEIMLDKQSIAVKGKHIVYVDWSVGHSGFDFEDLSYEDYLKYKKEIIW